MKRFFMLLCEKRCEIILCSSLHVFQIDNTRVGVASILQFYTITFISSCSLKTTKPMMQSDSEPKKEKEEA